MAARGMSTVVFGYSSDTSVEAGNELAEALLMNPKLVLFAAGGNDLANGITNYLTNLPAIKAAFTNATVVWVAPTARGATDMSPLARWMLTNAPGSYIDAYSATKGAYNVTGSGTFSAYVGPDNVHPNTEGHWAVFTVARNWLRAHGWFVP